MSATPAVVAHRGASGSRAEHTLAAYAQALEEGADGLECDVRLSRDGYLICVHDRRVDRTSTGRGIVSELSLAELAELDFGSWHDEWESADELIQRRVATPSASVAAHGLLTLDELLGLISDARRRVRLFVETKHPTRYGALVEAKLVASLARFGLAKPASAEEATVTVMSFSSRALHRVRGQAPAVPTVLLLRKLPLALRAGNLPPAADVAGPGVHVLRADPGYVSRTAECGHPSYCWTVDEPADVELCARLGVAYVATNHPARTRALLAELGASR